MEIHSHKLQEFNQPLGIRKKITQQVFFHQAKGYIGTFFLFCFFWGALKVGDFWRQEDPHQLVVLRGDDVMSSSSSSLGPQVPMKVKMKVRF